MAQEHAIQSALAHRQIVKSAQVLSGIVTGIVADAHLHDMEIQMLSSWISANPEVAQSWPGSAIARHLAEALADGVITAHERDHLLRTLQQLVGSDFAESGAVEPEVAALPFDETATTPLQNSRICLTGEFIYGTRSACERLAEKAGCTPVAAVSKKVHYLVVGTNVSPQWLNTSYGTKILRAMELRQEGHQIGILRERDWLNLLQQS
ncbi:hypothetical protein GmRootA79_16360 [Acidovorax sp. A79]|uniref:BRCT domain-containing protein n=1 Tax=Acidovorax sp. A79 TaxID=3056107 RepID=UPI0034E8EBEA